MSSLYSVLLWGVILGLLTLVVRWSGKPRPIPGIPHNEESALRFMGDVPHVIALQKAGKRPRDFWAALCRNKQSPIVQFFPGPFNKPVVVIADFREARDMLVNRSKLVDKGDLIKMMWSGLVPKHFVGRASTDPVTAESKNIVKDVMSPKYITTISTPAIYDNVIQLIELWKLKAQISQGRPFDVFDDLCLLTADAILVTALGLEGKNKNLVRTMARLEKEKDLVDAQKLPTDAAYEFPKYAFEGLVATVAQFSAIAGQFPQSPIHSLFWPITNLRPSVWKLRNQVKNLMSDYINKAVSRWELEGKPEVLTTGLQFMIQRELEAAKKQGRKPNFESELFHNAVYGYCFAGQDTTHSALTFLTKHLSTYSSTTRQVYKELQQIYPEALAEGRNPTAAEINSASPHLLNAYVEEILRLNPNAPAVLKEAVQDLTILGHQVPKGTSILFSLWGPSMNQEPLHVDESLRSQTSQDEKLFLSSEFPLHEFHPERWFEEDSLTGKRVFNSRLAPQIVFSLGPRECWGKRLAYLQIRILLTLLVWNFDFQEMPKHLQNHETVDILNSKPKVCCVNITILGT